MVSSLYLQKGLYVSDSLESMRSGNEFLDDFLIEVVLLLH